MITESDINFDLEPGNLSRYDDLRKEVRQFLADYRTQHGDDDWIASWMGFSDQFSKALAQRGWIGVSWPTQYGGGEKSFLQRYVIIEELLASGAPVGAHWVADRQSGPLILQYGSEKQKEQYLPAITRGQSYFCIGMSEPESGSDLAAARTKAQRTDSGWLINGQKLWTSHAHQCHYAIVFCRTSPLDEKKRHAGFSQFIVDLNTPGVEVSPVVNIAGEHHFNSIHFDNVEVSDDALIGEQGNGWQQVTGELAFERSGPERFMSNFSLTETLIDVVKDSPTETTERELGKTAARYWALRKMSSGIAAEIADGQSPDLKAALVKDLGTCFEQSIPELVRALHDGDDRNLSTSDSLRLEQLQQYNVLHAPSFTLRGGTTEVLRGIIARGMGLR